METTNVVDLGVLDKGPDLGLLQVVKIVVVGSTKISAQAAIVASDDGTATSGLLLGVDTVFNTQTSSLDGIVENGRILVITSTTEVDDGVGGKDILGTASGVLGGTTGDELSVVVVEEILVETEVLFLGEDGVVSLEAVFVEQSLVTKCLDIYEGMSELEGVYYCMIGMIII